MKMKFIFRFGIVVKIVYVTQFTTINLYFYSGKYVSGAIHRLFMYASYSTLHGFVLQISMKWYCRNT